MGHISYSSGIVKGIDNGINLDHCIIYGGYAQGICEDKAIIFMQMS